MVTNTINLKSPHELLAIVPFVLGFRPTNSIVVLCLSECRQVIWPHCLHEFWPRHLTG